jgi:hypothetical protein
VAGAAARAAHPPAAGPSEGHWAAGVLVVLVAVDLEAAVVYMEEEVA